MGTDPELDEHAVAIVGLSCRLPGAAHPAQFWENLCAGVESIRFLSREEALARGLAPALLDDPRHVRAVSAPDGIELFDASFFGFSPREAEILDPQQRLLLECAWEALEDAGYAPGTTPGATGVFAGATSSTYLLFNLLGHAELRASLDPLQLLVGNAVDSLATRVAYKLDLKGPAFSVQAACSTSLLAVHLACQSLLNNECDLALAGGVSINVSLLTGYRYEADSIVSPDGHCRAFDARAQGTVFGGGAGLVALKRLRDAAYDGDFIHAVIRGTAANNDGAAKVGYTAPAVEGQTAVIVEALAAAGVEPDSVSYVEAHGTGTSLGDPVEIEALTAAFRGARPGACALGTVKTNIGHLDIASGVAGLIKTALALRHEQLPPSLHFEQPNPRLQLAGSPFRVQTHLSPWLRGETPRRAGVSSFGFGGTNVHAVLEEAPRRTCAPSARAAQLLLLSARTVDALDGASERLAAALDARPDVSLADVAFTLARGRRVFAQRRALVATSAAEAATLLRAGRVFSGTDAQTARQRTLFVFPGQGAQHAGMGHGLYRSEPAFRAEVDHCAARLVGPLGLDLRTLLFPAEANAARGADELTRTLHAQPALFVIEYALARLLMSWGVEPQGMIGHSLGEYVAACLAGVFTLDDALVLVAARARLMESAPRGAMLAVPLPADELRELMGAHLDLAAINAPRECVVSGPHDATLELERALLARGVTSQRLRTSHAFHSAAMDDVLGAFEQQVRRVRLSAPHMPYISNLTGTWIRPEQATDANYWVRHLRHTVLFADGLATLTQPPDRALLEVGPGQGLSALARRQGYAEAIPAMRRRDDTAMSDDAALASAAGRLWLSGQRIDWAAFYAAEKRGRLPLPTYPFERQRYWIDAGTAPLNSLAHTASAGDSVPQTLHPRPQLASRYVEPRNDTESRIAAIWRELLGIEALGVFDDFFALGGHSLLATQLASRLREEFQIDLPLRQLFEGATVAASAEAILKARAEAADDAQLALLLHEIRGLSDDELERSLARERGEGES